MESYDDIIILLSSMLSRFNMLSSCLPDDCYQEVEEFRGYIISVLNTFGFNVSLANSNGVVKIDMVTLYKELSNISQNLANYILLLSNSGYVSTILENAAYNLSFIMRELANKDSVFGSCYYKGMVKVLK